MIFKKLSKFFLIVGVVSLIYWPKVYSGDENFSPFRFEFIFAISIIFAFIYFVGFLISEKKILISRRSQELALLLSFFLLSVLIATTLSYFRYNLFFSIKGIFALIKILLGLSLFTSTYIFLKNDQNLYKKLSWAFYLPPLVFAPLLLVPNLAQQFSAISGGFRFQGLTANPGQFAESSIIAFAFLYVLTLYHYYKKHIFQMFNYGGLASFIIALIFWSQMRTYIISIVAIIVVSNIIIGFRFKKNQLKTILSISLGIALLFLIFLSLSPTIRGLLLKRFSFGSSVYIVSQEPRVATWKYYSDLIPKNLLGLGINFEQKFFAMWLLPNSEIWQLGPHSILDLWAFSGLLGSIVIFYLLWKGFSRLRMYLQKTRDELSIYRIGTWSALIGIWVASFFVGSPIFYPGFWILLAMSLV